MPQVKEMIFSGITYSNELFDHPVDKKTKTAIDDTFLNADHRALNKLLKKHDKFFKSENDLQHTFDFDLQDDIHNFEYESKFLIFFLLQKIFMLHAFTKRKT